jgi:prevent-host-death family protein
MLHMKTVSLRHMQHHLSEVLRHTDHGEEVLVTRRNRPVARLVPIRPSATKIHWPKFAARAVRMAGRSISQVILDERDQA